MNLNSGFTAPALLCHQRPAGGSTEMAANALLTLFWCVRDASYTTRTSRFCYVIFWLAALIAFPFVFVIVSCPWLLVIVIVSYSLFSKPAQKQTTQPDIVLHKLVTGIK